MNDLSATLEAWTMDARIPSCIHGDLKKAAHALDLLEKREKQLMGEVNELVCELKDRPGYTKREYALKDRVERLENMVRELIDMTPQDYEYRKNSADRAQVLLDWEGK